MSGIRVRLYDPELVSGLEVDPPGGARGTALAAVQQEFSLVLPRGGADGVAHHLDAAAAVAERSAADGGHVLADVVQVERVDGGAVDGQDGAGFRAAEEVAVDGD